MKIRILSSVAARAFLVALVPAIAVAGKLPVQPDAGIKTDVHRKHVGKIVFSTAPIVAGKEDPGTFATHFKASQPIYWRAYFERSAANQARLAGKECDTNGSMAVVRAYAAEVDGVPMDSLLSVVDLPAKEFASATTWTEPTALNAAGPRDVISLNTNFVWGLAKNLSPGSHKIVLSAKVKCTRGTTFLSAPMAVGAFTLEVAAADITSMVKPVADLPRPARKDAALSADGTRIMTAIWKRASSSRRALRTIIVDKDWTIERHEISGATISRSIDTIVGYKDGDGCHYYGVRFRQDATSRGGFGETYFAAEDLDREDIDCAKLK